MTTLNLYTIRRFAGSAALLAIFLFSSLTAKGQVTITTDTLANGIVGTSYEQTLTATSSERLPITWSIAHGVLPAGLKLGAKGNVGVISGTPTTAGATKVTIKATAGLLIDSKTFTIIIVAPGRWATPADFANCSFNQFQLTDGSVLQAPIAEYLNGRSTDSKTYSTFMVKQGDYVKNGDVGGTAVTNNILSHANTGGPATFTGISNGAISKYYGCAPLGADSVIPLFVLVSPEKDYRVLSVSRINDLIIQSLQSGSFANKLELRDYGTYWQWNKDSLKYFLHTANQGAIDTQNDQQWDMYTSLQKFAIWIDADGNMTLYPVASYFWEYKEDKKTQNDNIFPNSVLIYNDIKVQFNTSISASDNKSWGAQIGWWNGYLTTGSNVPGYVGTIPSDIQTISDYTPYVYGKTCNELQYLKPKCDYQLVQNTSTNGADKGKYYTFGGTITPPANADATWKTNALAAHWELKYDTTDTYLATFAPELKNVYGTSISPSAAGDYKQTQLTGQYYFVKQIAANQYRVINVAGYDAGNFRPTFDTLTIACVEHTVPFYDLEADAGYNLMNRLAILEALYTDRNITYRSGNEVTKIYRGGKMIGYQTYLNQVGADFKNADYLTVYKENRRELSAHHMIPYYSFSVTLDGVEYFLNIDRAGANVNRVDSVYWTVLDDASRGKLLDWENNTNFLPTYKFCLPYQLNEDGSMKNPVQYADGTYPPVYMQTLDLAINDYPYLVVVGNASKYAATTNLWTAIKPANRAFTLKWNIYTVDYSLIDPLQVTAWIFGGQVPASNLWVPIRDAFKNGSKDGVITLNGSQFLDQTGKTPVNYGTLTSVSENNMKVEYEGDTLIGSYAQRPIWYYRVNVNGKYLTDATPKDPYSAYYYPFYGKQYPYGYFGAKLDDYKPYADEGINADQGFIQTFGFRYVTDSSDPDQRFYVVSNANYKNKPTKENEFRFLAQINDQLVFVTDTEYALVFKWGGIDKDGKYTDIHVVGKAGIYGAEGGVKFLSTSGKVDIYSIDGRLIKSTVLTGAEQVVDAPRGIAIVKAGSKVVKVVVQ